MSKSILAIPDSLFEPGQKPFCANCHHFTEESCWACHEKHPLQLTLPICGQIRLISEEEIASYPKLVTIFAGGIKSNSCSKFLKRENFEEEDTDQVDQYLADELFYTQLVLS